MPLKQPLSNRTNFPLYFSNREQLCLLDDEERGRVLLAAMDYAEFGTEPTNLSKLEQLAFGGMRVGLDRDLDTYQKKVETGRINGRLGGRPKKEPAAAEPAAQSAAQANPAAAEPITVQVAPAAAQANPAIEPFACSAQAPTALPCNAAQPAPDTEGDFLNPKKPNPFLKTPTATTTATPTTTAAATATPTTTPTTTAAATAAATPTATPTTCAIPTGAASGEPAAAAAAATFSVFWEQNMGALPPHVAQCMAEYQQQGCTDDLILYALERMVEAGSKNFLYARKILAEACTYRLYTRAAFLQNKRGGHSGHNILPTRAEIPKKNFLDIPLDRPRRFKRRAEEDSAPQSGDSEP